MPLMTYRDLTVWQRAVDLVTMVYTLTQAWPSEERYGLISQARRAATSIPANIAEGYGRTHRGDYLRHLSFARGSLMELETHIIVAGKLQMTDRTDAAPVWDQCQEVGRLLNGHIKSLKSCKAMNKQQEYARPGVLESEPRTLNPEPSS